MIGCRFIIKKQQQKKDWVDKLLNCDFFGSCVEHQQLRKNEKNVFCIDCNSDLCRHCVKSHSSHSRLQICKYVYHDVVRLQDMQKYLDCSRIQTYKVNGERAVHLNARPQCKDAKPSTKSKTGSSCLACGKYLQDLPNQFCSIACKVSIERKVRKNDKVIEFQVEEFNDISRWKRNDENQERSNTSDEKESTLSYTNSWEESTPLMPSLKPRKPKNKRKGTPRRAPIC